MIAKFLKMFLAYGGKLLTCVITREEVNDKHIYTFTSCQNFRFFNIVQKNMLSLEVSIAVLNKREKYNVF